MFAVLFEVQPWAGLAETYLAEADSLKPELEDIQGFVDNIRYKSLQRDGWLLSVSSWRDEKSLVRWRTNASHHKAQEAGRGNNQDNGRGGILEDYHLRVAQVLEDTCLPQGQKLDEPRSDVTEVGEGPAITIITGMRPAEFEHTSNPTDCAQVLGLNYYEGNALVNWDIFESLQDPRALLLMLVWRDNTALEDFENHEEISLPEAYRVRHLRVIRDYGIDDRREAPTYYPEPPHDFSTD
jgi:heme-degrading monooxygenase HmoA